MRGLGGETGDQFVKKRANDRPAAHALSVSHLRAPSPRTKHRHANADWMVDQLPARVQVENGRCHADLHWELLRLTELPHAQPEHANVQQARSERFR